MRAYLKKIYSQYSISLFFLLGTEISLSPLLGPPSPASYQKIESVDKIVGKIILLRKFVFINKKRDYYVIEEWNDYMLLIGQFQYFHILVEMFFMVETLPMGYCQLCPNLNMFSPRLITLLRLL